MNSPQSLAHKFKLQDAAIRGTVYSETIPDQDRIIKNNVVARAHTKQLGSIGSVHW